MNHEWCFMDKVFSSISRSLCYPFPTIIVQPPFLLNNLTTKSFSSLKNFLLIQWFQFVLLPLRCSFSPRQMSFLEFLETEMKNLKTSKRWNWVRNLTSVRTRSWKGQHIMQIPEAVMKLQLANNILEAKIYSSVPEHCQTYQRTVKLLGQAIQYGYHPKITQHL